MLCALCAYVKCGPLFVIVYGGHLVCAGLWFFVFSVACVVCILECYYCMGACEEGVISHLPIQPHLHLRLPLKAKVAQLLLSLLSAGHVRPTRQTRATHSVRCATGAEGPYPPATE